ncbi:MAG: MATE family efflux transporter [Deltaproteobacteria bacterium]|nr:MATE family efflux transporter [Deltaproteobacteria bacterium]
MVKVNNFKKFFSLDLSLAKQVVTISWPVVIGMLTQTMINIADTVMVGMLDPKISVPGQAALSLSLILLWAVGGFLSAVQVGTQALASRRMGANYTEKAGAALTNSLFISITTGLACAVAGAVLVDQFFPAVLSLMDKADPRVVELGIPYCRWRMINVFTMVVTISFKAFFDGIGKTYVHMTAALVMNILNLVLNWLLIFGVWIFPRMGVEGAGLASTIASFIGLFIIFGWSGLPRYRKVFKYFRLSNLSLRIIGKIVRLSIPSGVATVIAMTGFYLLNLVVLELDHRAVSQGLVAVGETFNTAATKIVIDILSITFMSSIAFGMGTATLVGQSLGAKKPDLAENFGWQSVKIWSTFFGMIGIITLITPDTFTSLFTHSQGVIDAARDPLRMLASVEFLMAGALILAQCLFVAGLAKFVMFLELTLHFGVLVPGAFVFGLVLDWGIHGVFLAAVLYVVGLSTILGVKWHRGAWKKVDF